jgi:hypothetical protein
MDKLVKLIQKHGPMMAKWFGGPAAGAAAAAMLANDGGFSQIINAVSSIFG